MIMLLHLLCHCVNCSPALRQLLPSCCVTSDHTKPGDCNHCIAMSTASATLFACWEYMLASVHEGENEKATSRVPVVVQHSAILLLCINTLSTNVIIKGGPTKHRRRIPTKSCKTSHAGRQLRSLKRGAQARPTLSWNMVHGSSRWWVGRRSQCGEQGQYSRTGYGRGLVLT
jgi:hypothetical protein